jgi:hypothetical protein
MVLRLLHAGESVSLEINQLGGRKDCSDKHSSTVSAQEPNLKRRRRTPCSQEQVLVKSER